jgi:bacteriocin biosynthesis cyclodehydratase domain-containing protein
MNEASPEHPREPAPRRNGDLRRPRLAFPFTVLADTDTVRLVAGEDFRYTFEAPGLDQWLPGFLKLLNGREPLAATLASLAASQRDAALKVVERLYAERLLTDAQALEAHPPGMYAMVVEGTGPLCATLAGAAANVRESAARTLRVFCQDRLDYDAALRFNRQCLDGAAPWLWVTSGPLSRGYVSPVFLPDAGPCLECLIRHFQRISPAPAIYTHLIAHARGGQEITPSELPGPAAAILEQLVLWKAALLSRKEPPPALYRLHVLEVAGMEVTSHGVAADPECPACHGTDA